MPENFCLKIALNYENRTLHHIEIYRNHDGMYNPDPEKLGKKLYYQNSLFDMMIRNLKRLVSIIRDFN